ncbi:MAG: amidohydrolase family protein, partial [Kangiellaceae bacterium]|nr:amidohydrolase family protein [Kangiellaceae bacterium]
ISLIRQTLSDAQWYQTARGKTDSLFTGQPVEYNAALESLRELKSNGIVFNADDYLSTIRADNLFDEFKINASFVADGHEYARIAEVKNTGSTMIVPLNFPDKPDVSSYENQLDSSLAELRHWERAPSNAAVLEKNKVPFALTQYGLKKADKFWGQVKLAVKHGLSEKAALAALTTTPAKLAGVEKSAGKIAKGMYADLVIADGNLFADGKIKSVWLRGQEQSFNEIKALSFDGEYVLDVAGKKLTLSLTDKNGKVTGTLKIKSESKDDEQENKDNKKTKSAKIKVASKADNALQFNANLDELGLAGNYRFSARLVDNQLSGIVTSPAAERSNFVSIAKSAMAKSGKKANAKKTEKPSYVGQITFPNRAFGLAKPAKQQNVHIKNATVWTSDKQGTLENADLIVRKGKIYKVGKNLKTPSGYTVIDGTGKHVTAGIIDEHSHIAISKGVNEGSDAITSEVRIGDVVNPDDTNIYRALAGGTTTAQLLHGSANPVGGQAQVIKLRWGSNAEAMKFKQAPGSIKFALGENVKQSNWGDNMTIRYPQTRMGVATIVRDAFVRAQDYRASWDKYDALSSSEKKRTAPPRRNYRMDALVEILESKRFIHSHSYVASEILSLMKIAEDFGFRIQNFTHILEGYKVADEMAKHGATASTFADWWAYKFEVIDAIPMNTCLMMKNGVNVSVNSDSGDLIRRLNTEAAKSINYCDMSQEDAIKMVTINPAIQLKVEKYTGSLTKGKDADFVIWNANPLSIYAKVEQTWVDGKKLYDREVDRAMQKQLAEEKNQLIQKLLADNKSAKKNGKPAKAAAEKNLFILKTDEVWHCDDDFDFWQWQQLNAYQSEGQLKVISDAHLGAH